MAQSVRAQTATQAVFPSPPHLAVVDREGDGQHILGVAHKAAGGGAGVQVPQAQGAVPTGEGEGREEGEAKDT